MHRAVGITEVNAIISINNSGIGSTCKSNCTVSGQGTLRSNAAVKGSRTSDLKYTGTRDGARGRTNLNVSTIQLSDTSRKNLKREATICQPEAGMVCSSIVQLNVQVTSTTSNVVDE